ncbi:uncharacterized protein LOC116168947 isoform X2 [Photinus pyralis]|uniref:uncharacterized protein LOC116168947 isoform X2 n=1 Tax=Photinus pyralis TaxID=7054 RepID=UPI0012674A56|nr:uncharacterized protein LOC116168947 isoform X2 [Photinus pyralis]
MGRFAVATSPPPFDRRHFAVAISPSPFRRMPSRRRRFAIDHFAVSPRYIVIKKRTYNFDESDTIPMLILCVLALVKVLNACTSNISQASLPNNYALKKMVRRQRNELKRAPPNPQSVEELIIPDEYTIYHAEPGRNENFLLFQETKDLLIFGRESWLAHLSSKTWFVDGTFKIAPPLYAQVYVLMVKKHNGVHPVLYTLLPNKLRATYVRFFNIIKNMQQNANPDSIFCDYESAALLAMRECFPNVSVKGCFFHLAKNMRKKLADLNLIQTYNTDAEFALKAKMVIAISFVPLDHLDEALDSLADVLPPELHPLLNWFEDNYVGRLNRRGNGRRAPIFESSIWNLYERTLHEEDRTNNHSEAAHRRLQTELGVLHPTLWKFIDALRAVQHGRDIYYESLVAGNNPPKKLRRYRDADRRILQIVRNFAQYEAIEEYLRGIAHNYQMGQ